MVSKSIQDEELYNLKIKGREYKKLAQIQESTDQPYWRIIKDIIEGKRKV